MDPGPQLCDQTRRECIMMLETASTRQTNKPSLHGDSILFLEEEQGNRAIRPVSENPAVYDNRFQGSADSADLGMVRVIEGNLTPDQLANVDPSLSYTKSGTRLYVTRLLNQVSIVEAPLHIRFGLTEILHSGRGSSNVRPLFFAISESPNISAPLADVQIIDERVPGQQLDPLDIRAQLDSLRDLKDGWADGMQYASSWGSGYGKAPRHVDLNWLSDRFAQHYPGNAPLPYIYPTPEGGVQAEWSIGANEISLELDFTKRTAEWHCLDVNTDIADIRTLDLDVPRSWSWLAEELQRLRAVA